jgi:hypothetical protein
MSPDDLKQLAESEAVDRRQVSELETTLADRVVIEE